MEKHFDMASLCLILLIRCTESFCKTI